MVMWWINFITDSCKAPVKRQNVAQGLDKRTQHVGLVDKRPGPRHDV